MCTAEGEYNTLALTASAREVLRGDVPLLLRVPTAAPRRQREGAQAARGGRAAAAGRGRAAALRRAEGVARARSRPRTTCRPSSSSTTRRWREMAARNPDALDDLAGISGVGAKKLQAYGDDLLRVLASAG